MADGSTKPIEAIRKGDRVLAYDESKEAFVGSEVVAVYTPYSVSSYVIINELIRVTEEHPFLSAGEWVTAGRLQVGTALTWADGSVERVRSMRRVDEKATVYNFHVAVETYVADGIVVHNKEDCEQYIQYCVACTP